MKYNKETHIESVEDVKALFHHLVYELKLNFHPDDSFRDYVSNETGEPVLSVEVAALYDRLMDESFDVCEKENADIYEIGLKELKMWLDENRKYKEAV